MRDISEFKPGQKVISFSGIVYEITGIELVQQKPKLYNSLLANVETGEIIQATHNKNKCFKLFENQN
jgi:hypothetical protein